MSNNYHEYFGGVVKWCKPFRQQVNQFGKWSTVLYPDPESLDKFNALKEKGLKNQLKKDEDGYNFTLGRNSSRQIRGQIVQFDPPAVVTADGKPWGTEGIGNGSRGIAKVKIYEYKSPAGQPGIAMDWVALKITDHVPYTAAAVEFRRKEAEMIKGLDQQPDPGF